MSRLLRVKESGQSLWLDNLSRDLIESGELKRLIEEDGIAGVTSNPTIFYQAIANDARYQEQLAELKKSNLSPLERYEALVIPDVQKACDVNFSQFELSKKSDGWVSLEVSPFLANDTQGTIEEAKRLYKLVDRKNLMIKVPATPASLPAISALIKEGIPVNVTLIFSREQALRVALAYQAGNNDVPCVASVFLSRWDSLIDPELEKLGDPMALSLRGKSAVSIARLAYQDYLKLSTSPRLLWASTGTKNKAYSDVLYIESLIGKNTVNTVPTATLNAFRDHGETQLLLADEDQVEYAHKIYEHLLNLGFNLAGLGDQLQKDGLKSFEESFEKLLDLVK